MRILFIVAALLCGPVAVSAAQLPQAPQLSAAAAQRIAPLIEAYRKLDQDLATLPAPKDDAERLLRLKRRDELGRVLYRQIDFVSLPLEEGRAAVQAAQLEIERNDIENQKQLKAMLPQRGWFLKSEVGAEAVAAAWLIVQHAINSDIALVRHVLASMKALLPTGEVEKGDYAMLADRVSVVDGVRQTYGTQMICNEFKWVLYPVEDEAGVDARRKEMGIEVTLADQLAQFATRSCPIAKYAGPIPK
ncbi:MAG: DUF6624 domain-containing protein [Rhodospirillaceae bacterium]